MYKYILKTCPKDYNTENLTDNNTVNKIINLLITKENEKFL